MGSIHLYFHGRLNDFLPPGQKNTWLTFQFKESTSLKHIIESIGVPHPEVGRIIKHNQDLQINEIANQGDRVEVFPLENGDIPYKETSPIFILDNHLGKLADYLRLFGFDTLYNNAWSDEKIAQIASQEKRILLTRDRGLLKRKIVIWGYCVRLDNPKDQLKEVFNYFCLAKWTRPFVRCARCNGLLKTVEKSTIMHLLQPLTIQFYDEFNQCQDCGQIYWKGSHFILMQNFINQMIQQQEEDR